MKKHVFKHVVVGSVAIAGFSVVTMLLWNWLMPCVFGLVAINFWQALGLLALARILFGGFGHHAMMGRGMHGRNLIHDKWMKLTDEERREFINRRREHMRKGHFFGGGFDFDDDSAKENE